MLNCIVGAVIFALGVLLGAYLYHRSGAQLSPFPVVTVPKLHKVRAAKRDEEEEF